MLKQIRKLEQKIYQIWDEGVSSNSRYFQREADEFIENIRGICKELCNMNWLEIIYKYKISHSDIKILVKLSENMFAVKTTAKKFSRELNMSPSNLFYRLIILESLEIVKVQTYNNMKLIYLHPDKIRKWKKTR